MQCLPEVVERSGKGRLVAWHTTTTSVIAVGSPATTKDDMISTTSLLSTAISTFPRELREIGIEELRDRTLLGTQDP
jgi:hypothetical protein